MAKMSKEELTAMRYAGDRGLMTPSCFDIQKLLDHIDALERDQSAREAAAYVRGWTDHYEPICRTPGCEHYGSQHLSYINGVVSGISKAHCGACGCKNWDPMPMEQLDNYELPPDLDSALDDLLREARREEAELWHKASLGAKTVFENYPGQYAKWSEDRVAELRSAPRTEPR